MLKSLLAILELSSLRQSPLWEGRCFQLCPSLAVVRGVGWMCVGGSSPALASFWIGLGRTGLGVTFIAISALASSSNESCFRKFINVNYL